VDPPINRHKRIQELDWEALSTSWIVERIWMRDASEADNPKCQQLSAGRKSRVIIGSVELPLLSILLCSCSMMIRQSISLKFCFPSSIRYPSRGLPPPIYWREFPRATQFQPTNNAAGVIIYHRSANTAQSLGATGGIFMVSGILTYSVYQKAPA